MCFQQLRHCLIFTHIRLIYVAHARVGVLRRIGEDFCSGEQRSNIIVVVKVKK